MLDKPVDGETNWGPKLNTALDTLDTRSLAEEAARLAADAGKVTNGSTVVLASDVGLIGDGVTDNSAAFTSAITNIKAMAAFSKSITLRLGRGVYCSSTAVILDGPGLRLEGEGRGVTSIKATAAIATRGLVDVTAADCLVSNLTIDANIVTTFGFRSTSTANRLRIDHVEVKSSKDHGLYLNGTPDAVLTRLRMTGCGDGTAPNAAGIFTSGCDNLILDKCIATGSLQHGYYLLGGASNNTTLLGCSAYGNGGIGISVRANRSVVTGCTSWGNVWGSLSISYVIEPTTKGSRAAVSGSIFGGSTACTANEVSVSGHDTVVFTGNLVETPTAPGAVLYFVNVNNLTVGSNTVISTFVAPVGGIRLSLCVGYLITGNTVQGAATTAGNGIYISASSSGRVSDNRVDNWNTAITTAADVSNAVHIVDNTCTTYAGTSPVINQSTGTGTVVQGNNLPNNFDVAAPIRLKSYSTAGKPTAASAGTGGVLYDSTLSKPVFTDGFSWREGALYLTATATLDFPSIAAAGSQELVVGVSGAGVGETVDVGAPAAIEAGLVWNGYVSASGVVKIRVSNITAAAIDPVSASWKVAVVR